MQKLFFVRHGQTQDNIDERWPRVDIPLTEVGREQAHAAGQQAKKDGLHFDVIIASPQPRAQETARIIAQEMGYPQDRIETWPLLVERDMGTLTGVYYPEFFTADQVYKDLDDAPGTEKIEAVQARAAQALEQIKARPEANILVVGHGIFGRAFRRAVLGLPYTDEYREARPIDPFPNATIVELV
ncbi:MAG TPA: histidine phosphatase family protein [Patescibacteria group bacterium]|nr:histidine phosphatase family protein [Patescibacteria group bacterium]